jgi:hypothetical protein
MKKLMVTVVAMLALMCAPRVASAGVGVSIGIGLPFPGIVVAPPPPVVYAPPVAYAPPVYAPYAPPVFYRRYWPRRVVVRPYPVRGWYHGHYRRYPY